MQSYHLWLGKKATIKLYGLKGLDWDGEIEAIECCPLGV